MSFIYTRIKSYFLIRLPLLLVLTQMLGATRILQLHIYISRNYILGRLPFCQKLSARSLQPWRELYCLSVLSSRISLSPPPPPPPPLPSFLTCMHGSDGFLAKTLEKTTSLAGKFSLLVNVFRKVGFLSVSWVYSPITIQYNMKYNNSTMQCNAVHLYDTVLTQ